MASKPTAERSAPTIQVKRVYDTPAPDDGIRVLVDRVWPRGVSRDDAAIAHWIKGVAPSTALRKWFAHDPAKWNEFRRRYHAELAQAGKALDELRDIIKHRRATLVFAARDTERNNAVALRLYLETA